MLTAHVYPTHLDAERAIAAIDAARNPDGTEEVTLPDGTRTRRLAKVWSRPIELEDGRFAVTWSARLAEFSGQEVEVDGELFTIPDGADAVELETVEIEEGVFVVRVVPASAPVDPTPAP